MVRNLSDLLLFVEKHRREIFPLSYLSEPLIAVWVLTRKGLWNIFCQCCEEYAISGDFTVDCCKI
jgi:hypothetical protein